MNQQASKTIGVALVLAAGLLAALFAQGVFAPPGAGAQTPPPPNTVAEVDGGRAIDEQLEFRVYPPAAGWSGRLDPGDQIAITFPADFTLRNQSLNDIKFSSSGDSSKDPIPGPITAGQDANSSGSTLTLTLPGGLNQTRVGPNDHLVITIDNSQITAPEIPRGFEDPDHPEETDRGYPVEVAFIASGSTGPGDPAPDNNFIAVKNPIDSTVPNVEVRVELVTYAQASIGPSQEITVDFSGDSADSEFIVPATLPTDWVTISYTNPGGSDTFSVPSSHIRVQGAKVTLAIPTSTTQYPQGKTIPPGEYTITFTRLTTPYSAGNRIIEVSSTAFDDEDEITAVIRKTTTIKIKGIEANEGPRGTEFILEGKGYAKGTVTVYHDVNCDGKINAGETLASANTVRGVFSVDLVAREPREIDTAKCPLDSHKYRVKAKDSRGVNDDVVFNIIAGILFHPVPARVGAPLKVTIFDWEADFAPEVVAVSIGGEPAYRKGQRVYVGKVIEYENCFDYTGSLRPDGFRTVSLEIEVPPLVPPGKQAVSVYGPDQLQLTYEDEDKVPPDADKPSCLKLVKPEIPGARKTGKIIADIKSDPAPIFTETILIVEQGLTLTPDTAARGQEVILTGSGFTRAARGEDHIADVWIGGERVPDDHSQLEVDTAGDFAFTVTVPLDLPDGPQEVLMKGNDETLGRATLTIAEAAITLDPPEGARGTELKAIGSGFVAGEVVLVSYGPETGSGSEAPAIASTGALADAQGSFELIFKVPINADVGKRHRVTAVAKEEILGGRVAVDAETSHFVPKSVVTVAPASVTPGDHLTVSALNLPPFTLAGPVRIAGIDISPSIEVATDETGSFDAKVLIPQIDYGNYTLLVQVGDTIVSRIIKVVPPPLEGPPSQVFKYLVRGGVLASVWHYDNATQSWSVFDPSLIGEVAALNDLTYVSSGDIVWVNMNEPEFFQDDRLEAGWNLIRLK